MRLLCRQIKQGSRKKFPLVLISHDNVYCEMIGILLINSSSLGQNCHHFVDDIFRYIFMSEKFCYLIKILLKFVSESVMDYWLSIGLDNGLAPNRQQAVIWTNSDPVHRHIYSALGGDVLRMLTGSGNILCSRLYWEDISVNPWIRSYMVIQPVRSYSSTTARIKK